MTTACASSRIVQRLTRWLGKCVTSISRISSTDISLATPDGVRSLRYIAAHTQDDILHAVFSDEEIAAAYGKDCDAVTNGVRAVEFCSCNLSKLHAVPPDAMTSELCVSNGK